MISLKGWVFVKIARTLSTARALVNRRVQRRNKVVRESAPQAGHTGVPELGISLFEVPLTHVKGRKCSRILVCNSAAQSVIEPVRGQHDQFVFVYQRLKADGGKRGPRPIETMNNTAWQRARKHAGLGDLHVHDLRHATGMRLREAGVLEPTIADILRHVSGSMTHHYSMAQIVELHGALENSRTTTAAETRALQH